MYIFKVTKTNVSKYIAAILLHDDKQASIGTGLDFKLRFMVFSAAFNNISVISWRSVLLVDETGETHRPT